MRFIGRDHELQRLQTRLESSRRTGQGEFIAMRGRRRVGKSRLVEEFAQRAGVPYVFYTAVQERPERELARFLDAVAESDAPAAGLVRSGSRADTWEAALELATRDATAERPVIVVIDEFPYLVDREPAIEAVLQTVWDRTIQRRPVLLILVGSDIATMAALSEERRPLHDRPREMVVEPLTAYDIAAMLDLDAHGALDAYVVIGGFPVLALEWGAGRSLEDYLAEALADPSSFLVLSAERALAAEFPSALRPRIVLNAIGGDVRANKEILQRTQMNATTLTQALGTLVEKRIVDRLQPYSAKPSPGNKLYSVADPYMRFWLRYIGPNMPLIERGRGRLLAQRVAADFSTYRGRAIEPIIASAIERLLPDDRFGVARHVGSFWTRTHAIEVDLVGGDKQPAADDIGFVGSIKWRADGACTRADAAALVAAREAVPGADATTRLIGVSRSGFDADVTVLDAQLGPAEIIAAHGP